MRQKLRESNKNLLPGELIETGKSGEELLGHSFSPRALLKTFLVTSLFFPHASKALVFMLHCPKNRTLIIFLRFIKLEYSLVPTARKTPSSIFRTQREILT